MGVTYADVFILSKAKKTVHLYGLLVQLASLAAGPDYYFQPKLMGISEPKRSVQTDKELNREGQYLAIGHPGCQDVRMMTARHSNFYIFWTFTALRCGSPENVEIWEGHHVGLQCPVDHTAG